MHRIMKATILSAAVAATTLATLPSAEARDRYYGRHGWHHRHHSNGDAIAAGVLGLAGAAIIAGALSRPEPVYQEPVYDYYPPAPAPRAIQYDYAGAYEPWSPGWYRYCENRYRTFRPDTGTFTGYDGAQHFCVAR